MKLSGRDFFYSLSETHGADRGIRVSLRGTQGNYGGIHEFGRNSATQPRNPALVKRNSHSANKYNLNWLGFGVAWLDFAEVWLYSVPAWLHITKTSLHYKIKTRFHHFNPDQWNRVFHFRNFITTSSSGVTNIVFCSK